jgi:hypothetical protein
MVAAARRFEFDVLPAPKNPAWTKAYARTPIAAAVKGRVAYHHPHPFSSSLWPSRFENVSPIVAALPMTAVKITIIRRMVVFCGVNTWPNQWARTPAFEFPSRTASGQAQSRWPSASADKARIQMPIVVVAVSSSSGGLFGASPAGFAWPAGASFRDSDFLVRPGIISPLIIQVAAGRHGRRWACGPGRPGDELARLLRPRVRTRPAAMAPFARCRPGAAGHRESPGPGRHSRGSCHEQNTEFGVLLAIRRAGHVRHKTAGQREGRTGRESRRR